MDMDMDDSKTEEIKSASTASVATSVAPAVSTPVPTTSGPIPWTPDGCTARTSHVRKEEKPVVAGRTLTQQEIQLIQEVRAMLDKYPRGRPCMLVVRFDTGMQVFEATPTCRRF